MILLDTHPLIWFAQGSSELGAEACKIIQENIDEDAALVSPITFWETAMLVRKGRVRIAEGTQAWADSLIGNGIRMTELSTDIAIDAGELSGGIHGDPADRLIVATARWLDCPLLTSDRQILAYSKAGHLKAINARR